MTSFRYVRWFEELGIEDIPVVGGKNASLGELVRRLTPLGVRVPTGFALTADAFRETLRSAAIEPELHRLLDRVDVADVGALASVGDQARRLVYEAEIPPEITREALAALAQLRARYGADLRVAVRSSATAEDLPTASFAGQHDSFLDLASEADVIDAVRRCNASLFNDRAIAYRVHHGFDHLRVALSVGIMKMVRSDCSSSGVIFTIDTETGHPDVVFVTGAWGLGEMVVQGKVDVDEFYVHKPTYRDGYRAVLRRSKGDKRLRMVRGEKGQLDIEPTPEDLRRRFCLTDEEVLELAGHAIVIEDHYSRRAGQSRPMDIEWAKDGVDGRLYIIQARPETVASQAKHNRLERYILRDRGRVLTRGRAVGTKIATGGVRHVGGPEDLGRFQPGEVLVARTTTPDWEPIMKKAAAIVTDHGGRTCHAAIVARELGIPAVVGATDATSRLENGTAVTVCCAEGDIGTVYDGALRFDVESSELDSLERPKTHVMVNLGNPELAFETSSLPCDGVGLARMEFIIGEHIRAHPLALLHPRRVTDERARAAIAEVLGGEDGATFFVRTLAEGVGTIAAAFYPRPVVVRMSDFKTNEYAALVGGASFEPVEENPMIGFRGASRYAHPAYREGFGLECEAIRRVRVDMGLRNVKLMIPFCRRLEEAEKVLAVMAEHGLRRGEDGLEIYVMCEIPNNVVLVDQFAALFDGFSIGSNDLTQLILGVDRDSEAVAFDFDERDPGVLEFMRLAVEGAKRNRRHVGICGQAPSDYPEIARFLVRHGIDSISLSPDSLLRTLPVIVEAERELAADGEEP